MSARNEKAKRQALRKALGVSKRVLREEAEFDAQVARFQFDQQLDTEIVSLQPKRRALAIVGLFLFFWAIGTCIAAALGAR